MDESTWGVGLAGRVAVRVGVGVIVIVIVAVTLGVGVKGPVFTLTL